jgi:hypothetical protein
MAVLRKRIKASTLVEVIIALLIGMMVMGMAMSIVVKTGKNYNAVQRTRALMWMRNRVHQLEIAPLLHEDTIQGQGMLIYEKLSEMEGKPDVLQLYMRAMTPEKRLLAEKWRLLKRKGDEKKEE